MTNPDGRYARWKTGVRNLTPAQIAHAEVVGHLGGTIGLVMALISMIWQGTLWYFGLFIAAMVWLQWWQFKASTKKYLELCDMQDLIKGKQEEILQKLIGKKEEKQNGL